MDRKVISPIKNQKVKYNDLYNATPRQLMATYKLSDRELQKQARNYLVQDGARESDISKVESVLYNHRTE